MTFTPNPDVTVSRDEHGDILSIQHPLSPYGIQDAGDGIEWTRLKFARQYLDDVAAAYGTHWGTFDDVVRLPDRVNLHTNGSLTLYNKEEKEGTGYYILSWIQAERGVPKWFAQIDIQVFTEPLRIIGLRSFLFHDPEFILLEKYQPPFRPSNINLFGIFFILDLNNRFDQQFLANASFQPLTESSTILSWSNQSSEISLEYYAHSLFIYSNKAPRPDVQRQPTGSRLNEKLNSNLFLTDAFQSTTVDDQACLVTDIVLRLSNPEAGSSTVCIQMFVDSFTGIIKRWESLSGHIMDAGVFPNEPVCCKENRDIKLSADSNPLTLNGLVKQVIIPDLGCLNAKPVLRNDRVVVLGTDIDPLNPKIMFDVLSTAFSAVSAYYNIEDAFRLIEQLGFPIKRYLNGIEKPVEALLFRKAGNASVVPKLDKTGISCFEFGEIGSYAIQTSADLRIIWHEFVHAILQDHIGSCNLGFAHSVGDAVAVILTDCDSCFHNRQGPAEFDRFRTFPFMHNSDNHSSESAWNRRHDRSTCGAYQLKNHVANFKDCYSAEQALSTIMFRIYQFAGGNSPDLQTRTIAAHYTIFLIFAAIESMTKPTTNAADFVNALITADLLVRCPLSFPKGCLYKIIRWSFEQQGLYRSDESIIGPGQPPEFDLYLDNGTMGNYCIPVQDTTPATKAFVFTKSTGANLNAVQNMVVGEPYELYLRYGNRGTSQASEIKLTMYIRMQSQDRIWQKHHEVEFHAGSLKFPGLLGPVPWTPKSRGTYQLLANISGKGDKSILDSLPDFEKHDQYLLRVLHVENNTAMTTVVIIE